MKKNLALPLLILLFWGCAAKKVGTAAGSKEDACKRFKNGTFIVEDRNRGHQSKVVRKGNTQVERKLPDGEEVVTTVKWVDDCKYIISPTRPSPDLPPELAMESLVVEIDSIIGNKQYFTAYFESEPDIKLQHFMTKID